MPHDPLDPHVLAVVRGDGEAFRAVYDLTSGLLLSVAHGLLGSRALAEDVVQDVFLRLVVHAGSLESTEGRALRAWLLRTTRNRCLDVRKSAAQRLERSADVVEDVAESRSEVDELLEQDLSPTMRAALEGLTADQRTALVLSHVAGLSGSEVADVMGRNRAAVYSILRRAERATRVLLAADSPEPTTPAHSRGR